MQPSRLVAERASTKTTPRYETVGKKATTESVAHHERLDHATALPPGMPAKTYLIVLAVSIVYLAQVFNLVGAGAYRLDIANVVGGPEKAIWLVTATTITVVVLGPPVSQAADFWGRRRFLTGLTFCDVVGSVIVSRASSMNMAIAGQVILSTSYGAQPLLHAVASEVLTHRNRATGQAAERGLWPRWSHRSPRWSCLHK